MGIRHGFLLAAACAILCGQSPDPALDPLERAYQALAEKKYEVAISSFLSALRAAPDRAAIHKDLAYAYLKIGETESARDQFAEAVRLAPDDHHAALEYAFLCHETGRTDVARHTFNRVRAIGDPTSKATAETAFQNIDGPLAEGIARWLDALKANPDDFNAHLEVARLAEKREDLQLAERHYYEAWKLRSERRSLLVDLGRVCLALGKAEQGRAALLAASRGAEPRAAEAAKRLLPDRYPYVYEFRQAIELDPENAALKQELGYLLEAMGQASPHPSSMDAKTLGERSYRAGYLLDALRYYSAAYEKDPSDSRLALQLGWTHNLLKEDDQAIRWFDRARKSTDPAVSGEASKAFKNLRSSVARFRTTVWLFPTYSSRWHDTFTYGQMKTEVKLGRLPLRAYVSARLIGDTRGMVTTAGPEYLSESSVILAGGLATSYWHGLMLWAEAGGSTSYVQRADGTRRTGADYRGGAAFYRGFGKLLGSKTRGWFTETNDDAVFLSRFNNDWLFFSQNRTGYSLGESGALAGLQAQVYWNTNFSFDLRHQYWANAVEHGPGLRLRWAWMPRSSAFSVNAIQGTYYLVAGNPYGRHYTDIRVGFWFAGTR